MDSQDIKNAANSAIGKAEDAAKAKIEGIKGSAEAKLGEIEAKVQDRFTAALAAHPKTVAVIAFVLGLVIGVFLLSPHAGTSASAGSSRPVASEGWDAANSPMLHISHGGRAGAA